MTPFGADPLFTTEGRVPIHEVKKHSQKENMRMPASLDRLNDNVVKISFSPDRLKLHDKSKLKITISDSDGIDIHHTIRLFYDGVEITDTLEKYAKKTVTKNKVTFELNDFRLLPDRENDIIVGYRSSPISPIVFKKYPNPICKWRDNLTIKNSKRFEDKLETLKTIENVSLMAGVNPNFIAGLVAQESSFDPHAVSIARAIGLTQVTALAEEHILQVHSDWPSYSGINRYSVPVIKGLIVLGKVNHENEWRLNPYYSIKGGIEYMEFIENYWKRDENLNIIQEQLGKKKKHISDILLASYNSGPYRVKRNLIKKGNNWLKSKNLKEARKYVKRVKSYCYHFSTELETKI